MLPAAPILTPNEWFLQLNALMGVIDQSVQQKNLRKLRLFNLASLIQTAQYELPEPDIFENAATILSIFYRAQIAKQLLALQRLINNLPRFFIPYCSSLYLRQNRNLLQLLKTISKNLKEAVQRLVQLNKESKSQDTSSISVSAHTKKRKSRAPRR
jgi:hypothetical protein